MVRVAVDASQLGDGSRLRGMGTVVRHLLDGLSRFDDLDIVALAREGVSLPDGIERQTLHRRPLRPRLARIEHDLRLPGELAAARPDVVWSPSNAPPRRSPAPVVQTIHDLIPLIRPHDETAGEAKRWRRRAPRIRNARTVVTSSKASAADVVRLLGVDPKRVEVVYLGVSPHFTPGHRVETESEPYLLYVSAWGSHKGFAEAAAVAELLECRLKIVGPQDEWMTARITEATRGSRHVELVGWADDLPATYRAAAALVCTSRAEGFGLPLLEAMACGTPVVAFANTSIPEVVGDAGLLVDDGDVDALAEAVRRILDEPALAANLRDAGLERVKAFTWEATAQGYHDVLVR